MKKIIFIGGTARSGSTLLDMILSNDSRSMSLGEIKALFHPTRTHHFKEIKRLMEDDIWSKILKGGKKNLYLNLIKYFPDIDVFIDSSKNSFWFNYHLKNKMNNYCIKNVLIYKTPEELASSFIKRGKRLEWIKAYEKYHRKYFSLIDDFISISYKDLVMNDKCLEQLCIIIKIPYFSSKRNYWEKDHETFFGSNTVKSENSHDAVNQIDHQIRHSIKYEKISLENLSFIKKNINENSHLTEIKNEIIKRDIFDNSGSATSGKFKYGQLYLFLLSIKTNFKNFYKFYYPENIFKEV